MNCLFDVEADVLGARTLATVLAGDYRVIHCPEPRRALEAARKKEAALLLLDLELPGSDAFGLLASLGHLAGGPPVIVHTARNDPSSIVRAMRCGATDYLTKPAPLHELQNSLRRARDLSAGDEGPFIGSSPAFRRVRALIRRFAVYDYPVLIVGESGTGKEIAARGIHELSTRRKCPFIPRNCAALPYELAESELFGSNRGAFTGALDRPGAFELAAGGTLFLDEIGEASPAVQAKLLRVLESGELWRLGGRESRSIDIRLISATSRDLKRAVGQGDFRLDLFYRIETLVLELPPLRERPEDIADLAIHFVQCAAPGRKYLGRSALALLLAQTWPGNVRQLRNVIQRAVVLSGEREEIGEEDIMLWETAPIGSPRGG